MSSFLQLIRWLNKSKNMNEFYHTNISASYTLSLFVVADNVKLYELNTFYAID